jgi:hypothetical protein
MAEPGSYGSASEGSSRPSPATRLLDAYARGERTFVRWNLAGASLHGANLQGCIFLASDFTAADLSGADLSHSDLGYAKLTSANLRGANLSGANLDGADLTDADQTGIVNERPGEAPRQPASQTPAQSGAGRPVADVGTQIHVGPDVNVGPQVNIGPQINVTPQFDSGLQGSERPTSPWLAGATPREFPRDSAGESKPVASQASGGTVPHSVQPGRSQLGQVDKTIVARPTSTRGASPYELIGALMSLIGEAGGLVFKTAAAIIVVVVGLAVLFNAPGGAPTDGGWVAHGQDWAYYIELKGGKGPVDYAFVSPYTKEIHRDHGGAIVHNDGTIEFIGFVDGDFTACSACPYHLTGGNLTINYTYYSYSGTAETGSGTMTFVKGDSSTYQNYVQGFTAAGG